MSRFPPFLIRLSLLFLCALMPLLSFGSEQRFSSAGFYAVEGSSRMVENFNPGWRFHLGDVEGAEEVDFDDSDWEAARLPHGLETLPANGSGGRNYQGIAWYRKEFTTEPVLTGGRVFLYFEAVMGEARVWVNGQEVVEHFGGYLPFAADVTDVLKPVGETNVVAVMANNEDSRLYPPGQPQSRLDFAYLGGIYRDVYLIRTGPVHVTLTELSDTVAGGGIFVATLDVNGNDADMEVRTEVANTTDEVLPLTVRTTLENAEHEELQVMEDEVTLQSGETRQLAREFEARDVRLWHPDDPYLHFIRTDILYRGQVVDSLRTRVGIRLYEMRGSEGFFINKEPVDTKFIGVNRHQDYNYVGNALPNSGQWRDVKLLREGGSRAIRAAHYPKDPAFYDACDEFGVITTTANPGWHFYNFDEPIFKERLLDDTRQLVRRDRNVASIVMWETVINEYPSQPTETLIEMNGIAKTEYPFPGFFTIGDPHEAKRGGFDMYYRGNDPDINAFNREFGDGSEVDNWRSQNARQRIKMEWGENAMIRQALIQGRTTGNIWARPPHSIGGAMWCGIDHDRGYHPDPFHGGLLNGFRIPRYNYYLYQSQYDPDYEIPGIGKKPVLFITNELTQISGEDVVVFSNCDEVTLRWMDKEFTAQKPDDGYGGLPNPPFTFTGVFDFIEAKQRFGKDYDDAILVAEGLVDGEVVITTEKRYPQRTTGITLEVDDEGMQLVADGSDFLPVRAHIVDQNGTKKVLASEFVYFEVEGQGELIGDASTFANPMKTAFGTATALVRSTLEPGKIRVAAHVNGLKSDSIVLESIEPSMPLAYDESYSAESREPETNEAVVVLSTAGSDDLPTEVRDLQEIVRKLRLDVVGRDQEIQELRGQLGTSSE
ncbi:MAG: glycoside hydrolase family 2 TIM barrel-domain containing protein [Verrucomicrobiota bacterium]